MDEQKIATATLRMPIGLQADLSTGLADDPTVVTNPASGTSASIAAHGEFDLHTANLIASAIRTAVEQGARHLVVDLRRVTLFDCSALHALMGAAKPLRSEPGAHVALTGAHGIVKRFLDVVGIDPLAPLDRPRDDAIAALRAMSSGLPPSAIAM